MVNYIKYFFLLLILGIAQKLLIWLFAVSTYEITPDIVVIGLTYIAIREGKMVGSIGGFAIGLLLDLFSFSFLGLSALSKASAGFVAGFFNDENKIERYISTWLFVLIVFLASLINSSIYFLFYFQGTSLSVTDIFLRYILTSSLYTSFISIIVIILEKKRIIRI